MDGKSFDQQYVRRLTYHHSDSEHMVTPDIPQSGYDPASAVKDLCPGECICLPGRMHLMDRSPFHNQSLTDESPTVTLSVIPVQPFGRRVMNIFY